MDSDSRSIDTQELLGSRAAQGGVPQDTASSSSNPRHVDIEPQATTAAACASHQQQRQQELPQLGIPELLARCMACLEGQGPGPGGPRDLGSVLQELRRVSDEGQSVQAAAGGLARSCMEVGTCCTACWCRLLVLKLAVAAEVQLQRLQGQPLAQHLTSATTGALHHPVVSRSHDVSRMLVVNTACVMDGVVCSLQDDALLYCVREVLHR
jgi:hypothetical protein